MATDKSTREQNLAIRVMRLSRPHFNEQASIIKDHSDVNSQAITNRVMLSTTDVPIGSYLVAPHAMNVYLGESFNFYISIINTSVYTCRGISIKADVQTQTQRVSVSEMAFTDVVLAPNQQIGRVFTHEIQEMGQHILVCAVSYIGANEENFNLRKFFKFPVSKPIELIKQNFYELEENTAFYEVQIQNLCANPIYIEALALTRASPSAFSELLTPPSEFHSDSLGPQSIRQYLFRLTPTEQMAKNWRTILSFGKLAICWRTAMGERGRMELESTQRMVVPIGNLRFLINDVPKRVKANELFSAHCTLQNCSDRPQDLILNFDQPSQPSIIHCSINGQRLKTLLPNHSLHITLDLLPYVTGLQKISGIRVTDLQLKKVYEFDDLVNVFVY